MRKVLFIILLCYANMSYAQPVSESTFKYFGVQVGAAMSNMNFNQNSTAPDGNIKAAWKPGFTFGFLLKLPLSESFSLQPEWSFTRRFGTNNTSGIDYRLDYLSMPLLLKYLISDRFEVLAGPQLELLVDAHSTNNDQNADITHDVEERSIGFVGGLEVHIADAFFISARYFQGFNHIGVYQRSSDVKEFKYQVVSLTAGMNF